MCVWGVHVCMCVAGVHMCVHMCVQVEVCARVTD